MIRVLLSVFFPFSIVIVPVKGTELWIIIVGISNYKLLIRFVFFVSDNHNDNEKDTNNNGNAVPTDPSLRGQLPRPFTRPKQLPSVINNNNNANGSTDGSSGLGVIKRPPPPSGPPPGYVKQASLSVNEATKDE
jgi:hypothetical protein